MLIGQAPGRREALGGRPFMGQAGRRLFSWFATIGMDEFAFRRMVYMTSVTKCYPGLNRNGHGDRIPSREERDWCRPFLEKQLRFVRPSLGILGGTLAISTILGDLRLANAVGKSFERDECQWVPLPHPSGASVWLNQPSHRELLRMALCLLKDSALTKELESRYGHP